MTSTVAGSGCLRRWLAVLTLCLVTNGTVAAVVDSPAADKTIAAVRVTSPPIIDGRLDDAVWQQAPVIDDLHMVIPDEYAPPTERSQIRVLYGPDALYFSARFFDREPELVSANVMRQGDMSWGEDGFSIILDPMNRGQSGYLFDINPNGVRTEALYTNVTEQNWHWQAIWRGAAQRDDEGWTAEVEIPFKTLSFDPANPTWGLNFTRWLGRRNQRFGWVSHNRNQNPANSGQLTGIYGIDQGVGLDVVPGLRVGETRDFASGLTDNYAEPSLDVFYKITPALTGALTLNTDFSGTTADTRQINLTRFDLFFPEQRQFFLQDADIFEFGRIGNDSGKPFFSRRIGLNDDGAGLDIDGGLKLTGRAGRFAVGVLGIRQHAQQGSGSSDLFVTRLSANVLGESSLGLIATGGNPLSAADNSLYGIDFRYLNTRLSENRSVIGAAWYQQSDTDGREGDSAAFGLSLGLPARRGWQADLSIKEVQADYFPALGFVNRTGVREGDLELGYSWRPSGHWLRSITSSVEGWRVQTIDGELQSQQLTIKPLELENQTADTFALDLRRQRERLDAPFEISAGVVIPVGDYTFDSYCANATTGQHRDLSGKLFACDGEFYDGMRASAGGEFIWRPSPHFRFDAALEWNDIKLPYGDFTTRLASLRADIAMTSTWYWENLVQYDNVSESIGVNSIVRWLPEAGREIVLVANHRLQDVDGDNRFRSRDREITFKVAYTLRF